MKPLSNCQLYTFVDTGYLHARAPEEVARQLCDGGSDLIQLRAKNSTPEEIRSMARAILPITRAAKVALVINDDLGVARDVGAEFCHLGQEDFFGKGHRHVSELESSLSPSVPTTQVQVGLSSHAPVEAERAVAAGAAYVAIGPVYPTPTKPAAKPVTLEYVRWAAAHLKLPWFAIGGISLQNLDEVLAAGARRICVVSAILNSINITRACQEFKARLLSAR